LIGELRPAGFWRRAAAFATDALWLFCVTGSLSWLVFGIALPAPAAAAGGRVLGARLLQDLVPALVIIVGWTRYGTTPGKCLLALRVCDAGTGGRPDTVQSVVRYLGYLVSALPLGLGFVWMVFDPRRQALHDKLARTRVVVVEESIVAPRAVRP